MPESIHEILQRRINDAHDRYGDRSPGILAQYIARAQRRAMAEYKAQQNEQPAPAFEETPEFDEAVSTDGVGGLSDVGQPAGGTGASAAVVLAGSGAADGGTREPGEPPA